MTSDMYTTRNKRIVVFGGTGFIGRELVAQLARGGAYVTLFARHPERCREIMVLSRVRAVAGDVNDPLAVARALAGQDAAVNLVGMLDGSPKPMRALHVDWPARLVESARGVDRIVHVGAAGADPDGPSRYIATKGEGEAEIRTATAPWTILAPSVVFGPGDSLFNRFATLLKLAPGMMPVVRPEARFSPVYVGDVARAIVQVMIKDDYAGQRFELGGPDIWTMREILEYTRRQLGIKRALINQPEVLAKLQARIMGLMPGRPFSLNQLHSLSVNTDVGQAGLDALGIVPSGVEAIVPDYLRQSVRQAQLDRFRGEGGGGETVSP
jgi:NADH dehydrogenase